MFIYEYMAGFVEIQTGGENDESYDPHDHRKVEKPTSYHETMIHLLKCSIGAGILAMPEAFRRVGLLGAVIGLVLIGIFATYCIQLLIAAQYQLCKKFKRGYIPFPDSMELALKEGPQFMRWTAHFCYYLTDGILILWQLGVCVIYVVFFAENVKQVCDYYGAVLSIRLHMLLELVPLILFNLVKDLKLMTPISTISNVVTIFGLILVFFYLAEDDLELPDNILEPRPGEGIPVFVGITLFAIEAVGVVLALEYNMENPKQFVGIFGLFNIGMLIIVSLYMLVGFFGYLKYSETTMASITLNLPYSQKKAQAAKIIFAIAIFFSFPLQNFVAYNIVWVKVKDRLSPKWKCPTDYALRVMLVVLPWLLAVAIPQLGPFISLFGALCLSLLAVVFPAVMDLCIWYPSQYGLCYYKLVRDILIIIGGLSALFSGCYTSILEIVEG